MSFFFDQNLSRRLPVLLAEDFPGCQQAFTAGMAMSDDLAVWSYAIGQGLTIVTKDVDFVTLSSAFGHPPKVVWLRVGNCPTADVVTQFKSRIQELQQFLADPMTALLVLQ